MLDAKFGLQLGGPNEVTPLKTKVRTIAYALLIILASTCFGVAGTRLKWGTKGTLILIVLVQLALVVLVGFQVR